VELRKKVCHNLKNNLVSASKGSMTDDDAKEISVCLEKKARSVDPEMKHRYKDFVRGILKNLKVTIFLKNRWQKDKCDLAELYMKCRSSSMDDTYWGEQGERWDIFVFSEELAKAASRPLSPSHQSISDQPVDMLNEQISEFKS
jgi:hypothetical protein